MADNEFSDFQAKILDEAAEGDGTSWEWPGGTGTVTAQGTFSGATITFQYSVDSGSTWHAAGDETTFTAAGGGNFTLPLCDIRGSVSENGTPDVDLYVTGLDLRRGR